MEHFFHKNLFKYLEVELFNILPASREDDVSPTWTLSIICSQSLSVTEKVLSKEIHQCRCIL